MTTPVQVAVDVGGTFTDVVAVRDGRIETVKVPTDIVDSARGVLTGLAEIGISDAAVFNHASTAGLNASCDKAWFGWPCDEQIERLRDQFARETDPDKQKALAEQVQARALEVGTHAYLGQWYQPLVFRNTLSGVLEGPAPFFWNIAKQG